MKMKRCRGFLIRFALVIGLLTGMNLTAYADTTVWYTGDSINLYNDVKNLTLNPSKTQTLILGEKVAFSAAITPDKASDKTVKWTVGGKDPGAVKLYSDAKCTSEVGPDATAVLTVYAKGISAGSAVVSVSSNYDSTKTASCTVTVNEEKKSYTVTFNANGHGTAPAAQTVPEGKTAEKPADLTAAGYSFGGWYTEAACTGEYNFSSAVTADITLYAKWTAAESEKQTEKEEKKSSVSVNAAYTPAPPMASNPINALTESVKRILEYDEPAGASYGILKAGEYEARNNSITIGWKEVPRAAGYAVYGAQAGVPYQKLADAAGTSFKQECLIKGETYKYFIAAYDSNGNILAVSRTLHVTADKNNPKSIHLKKKKASLSTGGTFNIKASVKGGEGYLRYESCNPAVAEVSVNGVVKAVSPGNCTIYVITQNGISKKCKITVK